MIRRLILIFSIASLAISCDRETCPPVLSEQFSDGMVLPKDKAINVYGSGQGLVKIDLNGVKARCRAKNGCWNTSLPPMTAGGPYTMTIRSNGTEKKINDVYVGTVLMLSGQSNMQFKMEEGSTPKEEWTGDSLIRSFSMPRIEKGEPYTPADGWVRCTDENVGKFSAIGYLAASELRRKTGEAVGLVNCYQGASSIEAWMPEEYSEKPEYRLPDEKKHRDHFHPIYHAWNVPGMLYNLNILPFAPYSLSAVVWYQGESNTGLEEYKIYPAMFADMAAEWRKAFNDEDLPFIVIEIANYVRKGPAWPKFQKAQATIPDVVSNSIFVRSADVCDSLNIHPADKKALSLRVADAVTFMTGGNKAVQEDSFSLSEFRNPGIEYRAKPFWSLNDSLDTEEMRVQLEGFKDAGYGGAFLHSRIGLLTPYLSDEWFHYMDEGVKACQELGIEAWFYDEDKWPSGFAGGIIPRQDEKFRAHSLLRLPLDAEASLAPEDKVLARHGNHIYVDFQDKMGQSWYNGTCWVDLMNPDMVKAFIDCSYEPYVRRYAGQPFVKGIFSDEPQVSPRTGPYESADAAIPYSPVMEKVFKDMWGYDLDPVIPALLDTVGDWRKVRLHYYRTVAHCMETAFSAQIGQYCADNDFLWTGHYNGEEMSSANMKNEGDLQHQLRNLQVPGVDALGLKYKNNHNDRVMTSTANQYGQKRRLVEIFGISGHNLSFEERMWVTAWHTNSGANLMCPHLSLYSMKGERKRDYPPTFSYQQPYFSQNKLFEDFSARLCYFATAGRTIGQACVLSTIETDYIVNGPQPVEFGSNTYGQTENIIDAAIASHLNIDIADEQFIEEIGSVCSDSFIVGQMAYTTVILPHLYTIRKSTLDKLVEYGRRGGCILIIKDYPKYVDGVADEVGIAALKGCSTLLKNDETALREALLSRPNDLLVSGPDAGKVMTHLRKVRGGRTAQVSNMSPKENIRVRLALSGVEDDCRILLLDPIDGKVMSFANGSEVQFAPSQTYVMAALEKSAVDIVDGEYKLPLVMTAVQTLPVEMKGRRLDPNAIPIDFAECSRDGGRTWSDAEPVLAIYKRSQSEIYDGPMMLRYSFNVETVPANSFIAVEQPWIYSSISINGHELKDWGREYFIDKLFRRRDVTGYVSPGRNTVILSLDYKSPRVNSYNAVERYGTEIETIYFAGDFAVNGRPAADQPTTTWRNSAPRLAPKPLPVKLDCRSLSIGTEDENFSGNITTSGYPFYAGSFEYETNFVLPVKQDGKRYVISFPGIETILLGVTLNGKQLSTVFCSPWQVDVTEAIAQGNNALKLVLTGSLRNLMGPHHNVGGEFFQVGPSTFVGGNEWPNMVLGDKDWLDKRKSGNAILWRDDYYCIPFGLLQPPVLKVEN